MKACVNFIDLVTVYSVEVIPIVYSAGVNSLLGLSDLDLSLHLKLQFCWVLAFRLIHDLRKYFICVLRSQHVVTLILVYLYFLSLKCLRQLLESEVHFLFAIILTFNHAINWFDAVTFDSH